MSRAELIRKEEGLTLILLTWSIGWAPNNASKWQIGFNSAFKGLSQWKIEPATFRLVAQCVIRLRHRVPPTLSNSIQFYLPFSLVGWERNKSQFKFHMTKQELLGHVYNGLRFLKQLIHYSVALRKQPILWLNAHMQSSLLIIGNSVCGNPSIPPLVITAVSYRLSLTSMVGCLSFDYRYQILKYWKSFLCSAIS